MNFISIIGLFVLLGIAWLMSYHRDSINYKSILWGISLQFLFALIILRNDYWSFVGMSALGLLIITYILQKDDSRLGGGVKSAVIVAIASLAVGAALFYIPGIVGIITILILVFMILNAIFKWQQAVQRYSGALFVISGIAYMVSHNLHGQVLFKTFSDKVAAFLNLSDFGAKFLFANLADGAYFFTGPDAGWPGFGFQFAFKVLPTIIFFGGFMSVLYYLGIMQLVIQAMSRFMRWTIGTSGAETLSCSANIFVGQTEAPLLIKPFLNKMTKSELLTVMVGGFATIAGGVLAGYIAMGVPAGHLIAASVMSAPAALVVGKIIYPEKEHSETAGDVDLPDIKVGDNVIEAATNGITDGLKLAVNVGAMLIGFIALIAVIDVTLNWLDLLIDGKLLHGEYIKYAASGMSPAVGEYSGIIPGSLQTFFGTLLRPLAWLMGVTWSNADKLGNLMGIKLSLNEFVAYGTLGNYINNGVLDERTIDIATYALCGFANFSSIGIQIGGISALAPNRRKDLARVGLKAMFGGAIASFMTATIAGMLL
ncbi:MAG: NupC/NupG family nucleoside CNT transporter [FCB group bacterium]|nr:NupC/NupG family nucleoside CNT transporter [FCB group bacterium]